MTRFSWLSDTHLDSVNDHVDVLNFIESVAREPTDFVIHTGDVSTSKDLIYNLSVIERVIDKPIYFVLGNHDFYESGIEQVRKSMHELMNVSARLKYMSELSYVALSPSTALVGHDGWYDCRASEPRKSRVVMTDWLKIRDYVKEGALSSATFYSSGNEPQHNVISAVSQSLADVATAHVAASIKAAVRYHKHVIVITHFPPFVEGTGGDSEFTPFYTNFGMGMMLRKAADAYKNVMFDVFSGHSHLKKEVQISKNMRFCVRDAVYGKPASRIISID